MPPSDSKDLIFADPPFTGDKRDAVADAVEDGVFTLDDDRQPLPEWLRRPWIRVLIVLAPLIAVVVAIIQIIVSWLWF